MNEDPVFIHNTTNVCLSLCLTGCVLKPPQEALLPPLSVLFDVF